MRGIRTTQSLVSRSYSALARPVTTIDSVYWRTPASSTANSSPNFIQCTTIASHSALCTCKRPLIQIRAKHKKSKARELSTPDESEENSSRASRAPKAEELEPFDFSDIETVWSRTEIYHTEQLKQFRAAGGRFNPDVLGSLPVRLDKTSADAVPLHDVAVIIPTQGRTVEIRMHEVSSKKAIMSAIQASEHFNQQPQPDADNDLVLYLKIEPESTEQLARRAKDLCHEWRDQVRKGTQKRQKLHQQWKKDSRVKSDDVRLLDRDVKKLQDATMAKIDAAEKEAIKQINSRRGLF